MSQRRVVELGDPALTAAHDLLGEGALFFEEARDTLLEGAGQPLDGRVVIHQRGMQPQATALGEDIAQLEGYVATIKKCFKNLKAVGSLKSTLDPVLLMPQLKKAIESIE